MVNSRVHNYARILGVVFILIGILGFVPALAPNGMLFGLFMVGTAHNMVHLLSGIVLLAVGYSTNWELARRVVLLFAAVYGLVTIIGFFSPNGAPVLGMPMNLADDILHLIIAVSALLVALPERYPAR